VLLQGLLRALRVLAPWLGVLVVAAGAYVGYRYYQRFQAEQARAAAVAALRTETVQRGDIVASVSATGSILPERQASLFFGVPGSIAAVLVETGQAVEAGQVLARLDDRPLQLALAQAEAAVAVAEISLAKLAAGPLTGDIAVAEANLRSANARLADVLAGGGDQEVAIAELRYDNLLTDYESLSSQYNSLVQFAQENPRFAPPQDTLDSLKANVENAFFTAEVARLQWEQARQGAGDGPTAIAYAQVAQARAVLTQTLAGPTPLQLAQAELDVDAAELGVERAILRLDQAALRAPFAGVVSTVAVKTGEPAGPGLPALVLLDLSRFHLDVTVDEVDVAQLAVGQPVTVTVDALPGRAFGGIVERLAPSASPVGGLVNYAVRLRLDDTDPALRVGMSATAQITVAEARGVVLVPNWAIRRDRRTGQAYASLRSGAALVEVPITTGLRGEQYTEVLEGVQPGDVAAVSTERDTLNLLGGP
jgi:HlyD family secretion protein